MSIKTFTKGSSVFKCQCCGRKTRMTDVAQSEKCHECDEIAMAENELMNPSAETDVAATEAYISKMQNAAIAKGGKIPA